LITYPPQPGGPQGAGGYIYIYIYIYMDIWMVGGVGVRACLTASLPDTEGHDWEVLVFELAGETG